MGRKLVGAVLSMILALPAGAQHLTGSVAPFDWSGQIPAGARLRVDNVHGDIRVSAATANRVTVHADLRRAGGHRSEIVFDVVPDGNDVTICARWADGPACTVRGLHDADNDDDEGESASADFTVQVPRGIRLDVQTGNGIIDVSGTGTDVNASSGNGAVRVSGSTGTVRVNSGNGRVTVDAAGGPVVANSGNGEVRVTTAGGPVNVSTGNGDIDVRMQKLGGQESMDFSTGNGTVTVSMPASLAADLDAGIYTCLCKLAHCGLFARFGDVTELATLANVHDAHRGALSPGDLCGHLHGWQRSPASIDCNQQALHCIYNDVSVGCLTARVCGLRPYGS